LIFDYIIVILFNLKIKVMAKKKVKKVSTKDIQPPVPPVKPPKT